MNQTRRPPQNKRTVPRETDEASPTSITVPMYNPAPENTSKTPVERIGDKLRKTREQRGDDLQQIADYLCIRRNFLEALEGSHYDQFPADAYVIGFLRSYANYLDLDGKEAIERYRNEMSGRRKKPALLVPTPITEGRTPSAVIMIGAAIGALLIYILWYGLSSSDRAAVSTPPALPATAASEPANTTGATAPATEAVTATAMPALDTIQPSAKNPEALPAPTTAAAAATNTTVPGGAGPTHLSIHAEQSSWILIGDSKGKTIYDQVMKPGDIYNVPDIQGLTLTTGNGSGILLTLDGATLPKLSTGSSHVLRNISLDPAHLRALPQYPEN